jgi:hypothetical protein
MLAMRDVPAFLTQHIQMLTFISGMRVVVVPVDC